MRPFPHSHQESVRKNHTSFKSPHQSSLYVVSRKYSLRIFIAIYSTFVKIYTFCKEISGFDGNTLALPEIGGE